MTETFACPRCGKVGGADDVHTCSPKRPTTPTVTKLRDGSYRVETHEREHLVFRDASGYPKAVFLPHGQQTSSEVEDFLLATIGTAYLTGTVQYEVTEAPDVPEGRYRSLGISYEAWQEAWLEGRTHG